MIFSEFAPNETARDAFLATKLLFQPWRWRKGKEIHNIKRRLKTRFFTPDTHISLFLTGRAALYQYLSSLHLHPTDEVLVQSFTCEAVILPILELELTPVYVDINSEDFSMNIQDLKKKYSPRARVLIVQHSFGITPKERRKLIEFAKFHKLHLIEDVAHGFNQWLFRTKRYTGAVLMSFGRSKIFSSVFGGAIAVRGVRAGKSIQIGERTLPNPSFWMLLQIIFYKMNSVIIKSTYSIKMGKIIHFMFKQFDLIIPEVTKEEKKGHFNYSFLRTFPNCAAIFMLEQLNRFNDVSSKRKRAAQFFDTKFNINTAHTLGLLRYPVLCDDPNKIKSLALKQNIQLGRWYSQAVAPNELDLELVGYTAGSCPNAESLCKRIINLPTLISIPDAKRIVKILNQS